MPVAAYTAGHRHAICNADPLLVGRVLNFVIRWLTLWQSESCRPKDWLNDAAKGYFVGVTLGSMLYDSPNLEVRAVTIAQLLAMKLAAWRDTLDRSDAELLLSEMEGSKAEIWRLVERLIPPHDLQKASYAFDDLWETADGPS